jgi:TIR domain
MAQDDSYCSSPISKDWAVLPLEVRWADAVLCVVSAAYAASAWCSAELGIARSFGCRLLPLRIDPEAGHPLLRPVQMVDHDDSWQRRIGSALRGVDAYGGTGWDEGRNPFPGLEPFDRDMHRVFFGRKPRSTSWLRFCGRPRSARARWFW